MIEVGDLVRKIQRLRQRYPDPKVYVVAQVEKRLHSDGRTIAGPHGIPTWCILHDDGGRLTATRSLIVIRKVRE